MRGWWIFAGTAAVSLLSKYVIKWRGSHVFNPSNFGLVLCFLLLGRTPRGAARLLVGPDVVVDGARAAIILTGGFAILSRLKLLWIARRLLGLVRGRDRRPRRDRARDGRALAPRADHRAALLVGAPHLAGGPRLPLLHDHRPEDDAARAARRIAYAVALGLLAALLIAPMHTEWARRSRCSASLFDRLRGAAAARRCARARAAAGLRLAGARAPRPSSTPSLLAAGSGPRRRPPRAPLPAGGCRRSRSCPRAASVGADAAHRAADRARPRDRARAGATARPLRVWLEPRRGPGARPSRSRSSRAALPADQAGAHWALAGAAGCAGRADARTRTVAAGFRLKDVAPTAASTSARARSATGWCRTSPR